MTKLRKKLEYIREKAIQKDMPTLTEQDVLEEVQVRRTGLPLLGDGLPVLYEVKLRLVDVCSKTVDRTERLPEDYNRRALAGFLLRELDMLRYTIYSLLGIACESCKGRGEKLYGDTATWIKSGQACQMATTDTCDVCWGTGRTDKIGVNLKRLYDLYHIQNERI